MQDEEATPVSYDAYFGDDATTPMTEAEFNQTGGFTPLDGGPETLRRPAAKRSIDHHRRSGRVVGAAENPGNKPEHPGRFIALQFPAVGTGQAIAGETQHNPREHDFHHGLIDLSKENEAEGDSKDGRNGERPQAAKFDAPPIRDDKDDGNPQRAERH